MTQKRILGILSSKRVPIKFLRNGKAIEYQINYLVRTNLSEKAQYLTQEEIKEYDNGAELLLNYQKQKDGKDD